MVQWMEVASDFYLQLLMLLLVCFLELSKHSPASPLLLLLLWMALEEVVA